MLIDGYKVPASLTKSYPLPKWFADFAAAIKSRTSSCNHLDANFLRYGTEENKFEYVARYKANVKHRGESLRAYACVNMICLDIKLKAITPLCISINAMNSITFANHIQVLASREIGYPVYTSNRNSNELAREMLPEQTIQRVQALNLLDRESLHIYNDGLTLYRRSEAVHDAVSTCNLLFDIAQALPLDIATGQQVTKLPYEFKDLQDLFERWAVGDDDEREDLLEAADHNALEHLVSLVRPRLDEINVYLSTHEGEKANAIGLLAETTVEAELLLSRGKC